MRNKLLSIFFLMCLFELIILVNLEHAQYLNPADYASLGTFNPGSNVSINMGTGAMSGGFNCTGVVSGGILIFTFDNFTLNSSMSINFTNITSGGNKVAFLSKGNMTIAGNIYANASGSTPGPGGFCGGSGQAGRTGINGEGPGGGTGNGDGGAGGGFGGSGGAAGYGAAGGGVNGNLTVSLTGGSGGGQSAWATPSPEAKGGGGGGALELGAKGILTLQSGCNIEAKGAAGGNAVITNTGEDGSGGGSGGSILIHSLSIAINAGANLNVSGGAGGSGGSGSGGAGGGGGGGRIHLAYHTTGTLTNNGTLTLNGGSGGSDVGNPGTAGNIGISTNGAYNNPALPVELQNFTAVPQRGKVLLKWSTATETNNYGFEIERKAGNNWQKLGFVIGAGNSYSPKEYSYTDKTVKAGENIYRLKQIDNDGKFEYSNEVKVKVNAVSAKFIVDQNVPNPCNPSTNITFNLPKEGRVAVKIFDILGKEIATLLDENKTAGSHTITWHGIDASGNELSSGIYLYNITFDGQSITKKMLLVR